MNIKSTDSSKPAFTPEQRRTLGMLYGFLIDLGRKRMRRLEQQVINEDIGKHNTRDEPQPFALKDENSAEFDGQTGSVT